MSQLNNLEGVFLLVREKWVQLAILGQEGQKAVKVEGLDSSQRLLPEVCDLICMRQAKKSGNDLEWSVRSRI